METGLIAIIVLIALVGAFAVLNRQGLVPWSLPTPRLFSAGGAARGSTLTAAERVIGPGLDEPLERALSAPRADARLAELPPSSLERHLPRQNEPARLDIPAPTSGPLAERLDRLEGQIGDMHQALERQSRELDRLRTELLARGEAAEARGEAAIERLRADILASVAGMASQRQGPMAERRSEVSADLFARLARLESALSAVTNPILLPGEEYAPPEELLTEALIWDNWSEVGERAFALADAFSAQRLSLSDEARYEVGQFVTAMRLLLTRSVYPNLQTDPDAAQRAALTTALAEIAAELPKVRASLDREYRSQGT